MGSQRRIGGGLAAALALAALVSAWHAGWSGWRAQAFGFVDYPIFLRNAEDAARTGELYRSKDDLSYYAPAAPVYKFPPLYAVFLLPVVADGADRGDLAAHYLLQLAMFAAIVALLVLLVRGGARPWLAASVAALLALNVEPFYETLWRLQLETPILLLVLLAVVAVRAGRDGLGGAALGVAAMLKVYPVVLVAWLLARRSVRGLVGCAAAAAGVQVLTLAVFGLDENVFYYATLLPHLLAEPPLIDMENLSLARLAHLATGLAPAAAKSVARLVVLPALAATAWVAWRAAPRRDGAGLLLELAPWSALMLLAMPNSWVNYQLALLPAFVALAVVALRAERGGAHRRLLTAALVAAYVPLLFYAPCADPATGWPCAQTPPVLGLVICPRGLHELFVGLRAASPLVVWIAALVELRRPATGATTRAGAYSPRPTNESIEA